MIYNNYAEVSGVLGQSEKEKQLALIGKDLSEALSQLKDDPIHSSNRALKQNTRPSELISEVMDRNPPPGYHSSA